MTERLYFAKVTLNWTNGKCLLVAQFKDKNWDLWIPDEAHSIKL